MLDLLESAQLGHLARQSALQKIAAVTELQAYARGAMARWKQLKGGRALDGEAGTGVKYNDDESPLEEGAPLEGTDEEISAATIIQAGYRGHVVRKINRSSHTGARSVVGTGVAADDIDDVTVDVNVDGAVGVDPSLQMNVGVELNAEFNKVDDAVTPTDVDTVVDNAAVPQDGDAIGGDGSATSDGVGGNDDDDDDDAMLDLLESAQLGHLARQSALQKIAAITELQAYARGAMARLKRQEAHNQVEAPAETMPAMNKRRDTSAIDIDKAEAILRLQDEVPVETMPDVNKRRDTSAIDIDKAEAILRLQDEAPLETMPAVNKRRDTSAIDIDKAEAIERLQDVKHTFSGHAKATQLKLSAIQELQGHLRAKLARHKIKLLWSSDVTVPEPKLVALVENKYSRIFNKPNEEEGGVGKGKEEREIDVHIEKEQKTTEMEKVIEKEKSIPEGTQGTTVAGADVPAMNARVVRVSLNDDSEIGLAFKDAVDDVSPITVAEIDPGGPADGLVHVGDAVLSINGNVTFGKKKGFAATAVADVFQSNDDTPDVAMLSVASYFTPTTRL